MNNDIPIIFFLPAFAVVFGIYNTTYIVRC